jgi:hypothetical protein
MKGFGLIRRDVSDQKSQKSYGASHFGATGALRYRVAANTMGGCIQLSKIDCG